MIEATSPPGEVDRDAAELTSARAKALAELTREIRAKGKSMLPHAVENLVPHKAALALVLKAEGQSIRSVMRQTGLSAATISRLGWHHAANLDAKRAELSIAFAVVADKARQATSEKLDMILGDEEQMKAARLNDLAITAGIMTEKAVMLSGGSPVKIETERGPTLEDAIAFKAEILSRLARAKASGAIEAEVVTVATADDYII